MGPRQRSRKVTDATALIACRLSDGLLSPLGVWEQPDGPAGDTWRVPTAEADSAVRDAFARYRVVGLYDGAYVLTRHALNARRRVSTAGIQIAKDHPDSPRKIDALVAAVLAFEARADAIAAGIPAEPADMGGWTF